MLQESIVYPFPCWQVFVHASVQWRKGVCLTGSEFYHVSGHDTIGICVLSWQNNKTQMKTYIGIWLSSSRLKFLLISIIHLLNFEYYLREKPQHMEFSICIVSCHNNNPLILLPSLLSSLLISPEFSVWKSPPPIILFHFKVSLKSVDIVLFWFFILKF